MSETGRSGVPVRLQAAGETHIGGRSHNEDAVLVRPDLDLYLVADGAGGQDAGNVASSLTATTIAHYFEQARPRADELPPVDDLGLSIAARRLSAAVQQANREIIAIAKGSQRHHGMGSTVVAALFVPRYRQVHVAHVGDSRFYRLRDGRLEQLTVDHSLLNDVMELQPQIDNARVRKLPRNVVTRALGMAEGVRVSIRSYDLVHGDRYLLCSDGISDVIEQEQLREALQLDATCEDCAGLLMEMALAARASDNIAAVVVDVALPSRRKAKSRPRMERYGITPRVEPSTPSVSDSSVNDESVPGVVVYGDTGPDHRDAQPGIQVTAHDYFDDDLEFDDEIVEGDEPDVVDPTDEPAPQSGAKPLLAYSAVASAAVDPATDASSPRRRQTQPTIERVQPEHPNDEDELAGTQPLAAAPRERSGRRVETPGAGRYTYVGASGARSRRSSVPGGSRTPTPPLRPMQRPAAGPPPLPRSGRAAFSQPRRHKATPTSADAARSGETVAPPELDLSVPARPSPRSRPPMPSPIDEHYGRIERTPARLTPLPPPGLHPAPPPFPASALPRNLRETPASSPLALDRLKARAHDPEPSAEEPRSKSLPPMRTPFETGEFMPDGSVVCHACGSVINSDADLCLYCGANTGFVTS